MNDHLDGAGNIVWSVAIGPAVKEMPSMRWLSQRTPTIDDDRVYAFTARGVLLCLRSANGQLLWKKDYDKDFGGKLGRWLGFCDFPLVDGDMLLCTPGGPTSTIVALDKKTGVTLWTCVVAESNAGTHSSILACELGGVRQYVHQLDRQTVGVSAKDGKLLWSFSFGKGGGMGNVHTAVHWKKDSLLTLCGWTANYALLAFAPDKGGTQFELKYKRDDAVPAVTQPDHPGIQFGFQGWWSGTLRVGDHLYSLGRPGCLDLRTGEVLWNGGCPGAVGSLADGLIYSRSGNRLGLYEPGPEKVRLCSQFDVPRTEMGREPSNTFPVIAGGRLYVRDHGDLYCFTVRGPEYKAPQQVWDIDLNPPGRKTPGASPSAAPPDLKPPPGEPDAIFVPTPQDVVEKMIDLAKVTKEDVVYDLGSGDGRIVLTASRNKGCTSVGFEINPGLVWESRFKAKQEKLDRLVTIEEKDLFTVDLGPATVVTLYLGPRNNERLLPQLRKLKPGSRIVSHAHLLGNEGPKPDQEAKVTSKEDGVEHTIYVWTTPLKP